MPHGSNKPSNAKTSISFEDTRKDYTFQFKHKDQTIEYVISASTTSTNFGLINIRGSLNNKYRLLPVFEGGFIVRNATGEEISAREYAKERKCRVVSHGIVGESVQFTYEEKIDQNTYKKMITYELIGKTLKIHAVAQGPVDATANYCGFDFGEAKFVINPKLVELPQSPIKAVHVFDQFYFSTYVDPLLSTPGHYQTTSVIPNARTVQASNTPAYLIKKPDGTLPVMDITAYVTISDSLMDVLPEAKKVRTFDPAGLNSRVALDIHELPLARYPLKPIAMIRRWEAPSSGTVRLKGTFALKDAEKAACEVHLTEKSTGKDHILFNQLLERSYKPATGIEGDFPLEKGDELLFAVYGPAVMEGGETLVDVYFDFEGERYSTIEDFSDEQGYRGWYYEQQYGTSRSLLIWNPKTLRWESPNTVSYQSKGFMASRVGYNGDAFKAAETFFDELRGLGMENLTLMLNDWPRHAHVQNATNGIQQGWGNVKTLKGLSLKELVAGNTVVHSINSNRLLGRIFEDIPLVDLLPNSESRSSKSFVDYLQTSVNALIKEDEEKMSFNGVAFDIPAVGGMVQEATDLLKTLYRERPTSVHLNEKLDAIVSQVRRDQKRAVILKSNDTLSDLMPYYAHLADALIPHYTPSGDTWGIVDTHLKLNRLNPPKLGMGPLATYFQSPERRIDPRFTPMDQYLSSTISFGRVPYLSTEFWLPGMTARDVRNILLEGYALLKPVAQSYLNPSNQVQSIRYKDENGKEWEIEELLAEEKLKDAVRLIIQYSDGLHIMVNRSFSPWTINEVLLKEIDIERDGFLARNEKEDMISLIGRKGGHPFTLSRYQRSYFLNSRDGSLLHFPPFATDGMVHIWPSKDVKGRNIACVDASEVIKAGNYQPIIRSNKRLDCYAHWISKNRIKLHILEAPGESPMVEYFDIPPLWLIKPEPLTIERENILSGIRESVEFWSTAKAGDEQGLRIPDIKTGDVYTITYQGVDGL